MAKTRINGILVLLCHNLNLFLIIFKVITVLRVSQKKSLQVVFDQQMFKIFFFLRLSLDFINLYKGCLCYSTFHYISQRQYLQSDAL